MSYKRYPVKRHAYTQKVGKLLQLIIRKIFLELGASRVEIPNGQSNKVDLKVWDSKGNLVIVGEILNWSVKSLLSEKRRRKMIKNLNQYGCNKALIYTSLNRTHLSVFSSNKISQVKIGYQVLPYLYYKFFQGKHQVIKRRPYSLSVKNEIKQLIKSYLKRRQIRI